jgi:hypothetical protein
MNNLCAVLTVIVIYSFLFAALGWAVGDSRSKKKAVSAAFRLCDGISKKFITIINYFKGDVKD